MHHQLTLVDNVRSLITEHTAECCFRKHGQGCFADNGVEGRKHVPGKAAGVRGVASEAEATYFISTKTLEEKLKGIPFLEGNIFLSAIRAVYRYYHSVISLGKLLRKHSSGSHPLDSLLGATSCIGISVHF